MTMEYRNIKTGAVINVNATMGGNWEPVKPAAQKAGPKAAPAKKKGSKK